MNIFKTLGYKKVKYKGVKFIVRKLSMIDFIEEGNLPFNLFLLTKEMTEFQKLQKEMGIERPENKDINKEFDDKVKAMKLVLEKGVVRLPKDLTVDDLLKVETFDIGAFLYAYILNISLRWFIRMYTFKEYQVRYWDLMAKRYGKLPIDCLLPNKGYTDVEAYIFNCFVMNYSVTKENEEAKRIKNGR